MSDFRLGVLLHFFQPYWQFEDVFKRITEQCYRPIFKFIKENPARFAFTANINYSLIELLIKYGQDDVLENIKFAVKNNLIELTGTAAYHPIIPLLPESEAKKQIAYDICKKRLTGISQNSNGFFFPEMAFSKNSLPFLRELGYNWTVIEDVAVPPGHVPFNYIIGNRGFSVFLRSAYWSKYIWDRHLDFQSFAEKVNYEWPEFAGCGGSYFIIAMDAETFGHHVCGLSESFLFPLMENWGNGIITPFEKLLNVFPHREVSELRDCSWSTSYIDIYHNNPYPLWKNKRNGHHLILWELVELALKYSDEPDAINDCLKMVNSCHWWWISRGFWNPSFMMIGARKAVEVISKFGNAEEKKKADSYLELLNSLL